MDLVGFVYSSLYQDLCVVGHMDLVNSGFSVGGGRIWLIWLIC